MTMLAVCSRSRDAKDAEEGGSALPVALSDVFFEVTTLCNFEVTTLCNFVEVPRELLEQKNKAELLEKAKVFALFYKDGAMVRLKTRFTFVANASV